MFDRDQPFTSAEMFEQHVGSDIKVLGLAQRLLLRQGQEEFQFLFRSISTADQFYHYALSGTPAGTIVSAYTRLMEQDERHTGRAPRKTLRWNGIDVEWRKVNPTVHQHGVENQPA